MSIQFDNLNIISLISSCQVLSKSVSWAINCIIVKYNKKLVIEYLQITTSSPCQTCKISTWTQDPSQPIKKILKVFRTKRIKVNQKDPAAYVESKLNNCQH